MTRRDWMPHPAKTISSPAPTCPRGTWYASQDRARHTLIYGVGYHGLVEQLCDLGCGGWHIVDQARTESPKEPR